VSDLTIHAGRLPHYLVLALLIASVVVTLNQQTAAVSAAQSFDMGWLRSGVRAWYFTVSITESANSKPSSLQLAGVYTIKGVENGNLIVGEDYLTMAAEVTLPSHDIIVQNPAKEGPIWISPPILAQLKTGDRITWIGNEYVVSKRGMTSLDELIRFFVASPLPAVVALYLSSQGKELTAGDVLSEDVKRLQRDVVIIEGSRVEQNGERTYAAAAFDVETGLLLAEKFKATSGQSTMTSYMVLAEINYDFLRHEAFPEPKGPHTGFTYSATYNDMSTGYGFTVIGACVGRYKGVEFFTLQAVLNPTYTILTDLIAIVYDEGKEEAYAMNIGSGQYDLGIPRGKVVRIGDHAPLYIPPKDLSKDTITVWGVTLTNHGEGTFVATNYPQTFGFTQLTFNEEGYVQSMGIYAVIAGTPVNFQPTSPVSVDAFQKSLQDYQSKLGGPVKPSPKPLITITTQTPQPTSSINPPPTTNQGNNPTTTTPVGPQTLNQGTSNQQTNSEGGNTQTTTGNNQINEGGQTSTATTPTTSANPTTSTSTQQSSQGTGKGGERGTNEVLIGIGAGIAIGAVIALAAALLLRRRPSTPPVPPPPPPY